MLLPAVIILGSVVVSIGLVGLFVVFTLNRSNYSIRLSSTALAVAQAGIKDAHLRLIRNPIWTPLGCNSANALNDANQTYILNVGNYKAYVCLEKIGAGYLVNSLGRVLLHQRQVKAILAVDPVTYQIRLQSLNEVQF